MSPPRQHIGRRPPPASPSIPADALEPTLAHSLVDSRPAERRPSSASALGRPLASCFSSTKRRSVACWKPSRRKRGYIGESSALHETSGLSPRATISLPKGEHGSPRAWWTTTRRTAARAGSRQKANLLCRQFQRASLHHAAARPPSEVADIMAGGLVGLARAYGWKAANDKTITVQNLWPTLAHRDAALPLKLRRLMRDHLLVGDGALGSGVLAQFLARTAAVFFGDAPPRSADEIAELCAFVAEQKAALVDPERRSTKQAQFGDVHVASRLDPLGQGNECRWHSRWSRAKSGRALQLLISASI